MITLTQRCPEPPATARCLHLALTAAERCRSRLHCHSEEGDTLYLKLSRGTILQPGEFLATADGTVTVQIQAKPEPTLRVEAADRLSLLQAAYHLGNRHVPLEIHASYLRLTADPVLQTLLEQRGLAVTFEVTAFCPEAGAYPSHAH
ncbi:urease accessory protein UreE [Thermosynechococcaceae cyanobacterium Okahandja]